MEDHYIYFYENQLNNMCAGCKFCDFSCANVNYIDEKYHGYDGCAWCRKNKIFISALDKKCEYYELADKDSYIFELCTHLVSALSEDPKLTLGKTKQKIFNNVLSLYEKTIEMYPPNKELKYGRFFKKLTDIYKSEMDDMDEKLNKIFNIFKQEYYG